MRATGCQLARAARDLQLPKKEVGPGKMIIVTQLCRLEELGTENFIDDL